MGVLLDKVDQANTPLIAGVANIISGPTGMAESEKLLGEANGAALRAINESERAVLA